MDRSAEAVSSHAVHSFGTSGLHIIVIRRAANEEGLDNLFGPSAHMPCTKRSLGVGEDTGPEFDVDDDEQG
ncbi:hypothetical protein BLS_009370 [Venturia inaequalis]|uniref:Uncharacterized protein n=1 Tax=Venturia inaequalis TaxID=5025 RepID=A0A8H3YK47_VENIN|nr:hypothetical protein BLS_009370 [Venturia inaequalis]